MPKAIKEKLYSKAFSLVELILVVLLIFLIYFFAYHYISFDKYKPIKTTMNLMNLKEQLLKINFKTSISLKCFNDGKICLLFKDEEKKPIGKISNFFQAKPQVFEYSNKEKELIYSPVYLKGFEYSRPCFVYTISSFFKSSELIVKTKNKGIYIFNSIFTKPKKVKNFDQVSNYFQDAKDKARDAF